MQLNVKRLHVIRLKPESDGEVLGICAKIIEPERFRFLPALK